MIKLSLVIPFYRYKNYLDECLQALMDSSFHDFEIVLVCDHIEESIDDLIEKYHTLQINKVVMDTKHGVNAARNLGVKESRGEYIYFLDSDDYILEDTLQGIVDGLKSGADIIYGEIHRTWNNKANYLEKRAKKYEEVDEDEQILIEENKLARQEEFIEMFKGTCSEETLRGIYFLVKRRKGIARLSVLGNAYRKAFLNENNILFDESLIYYGDIIYLMNCIEKATVMNSGLEGLYIKRSHNDPINYPALSQENDENKFFERMEAFKKVRLVINEDSILRYLFDRKIITYFLYRFARRLRRSENPIWRNEYFSILSDVIIGCRSDVVEGLKPWQKRFVGSLQNKDLNMLLKQVRFRLGIIKFKKILKNKNEFYKMAYYHIFLKKPILKNVVLFETFTGKNYSDSPRYIYEYLAKHYSHQFTFVWVLNTKTKPIYGSKKVRRFSFRYAYYLARANYLVFNARQPLWYRKREGQVFVETWHGTPLKRLVFDQEEVTAASPKYKKEFYRQRSDWDYLISDNDFSTETLRRCFMFENEVLDYGYPRNDILYDNDKDVKAKQLRIKLKIPLDKKTILYAPTWRDDEYYGKGQYKFTLKLDLALMRERLGEEYVILLRTHQYIADALDISDMEGFAYNLSKYDDISELYLISDICITDYSSVFFDFANLKRPILFYTYDIEKYKNQLRGFYIDMQTEVPGPLLYTSEEVILAIENIEQVEANYKERYEIFCKRFTHLDDGYASKRVVEKVFLK